MGFCSIPPLFRADLAELAIRQRLREDAVFNEAEGIPLGRGLGLEVPEDPRDELVSMYDILVVRCFPGTYQPLV